MVTREALFSHVSRLSSALQARESITVDPPDPQWPSVEVFDPEILHPFQEPNADQAQRECDRMLRLLRETPGANSEELGAAIRNLANPKGTLYQALSVAGGLATVLAIWHGYQVDSAAEALGGGLLLATLSSWAHGKMHEEGSALDKRKSQDLQQLQVWEKAIETGHPDRVPLFRLGANGSPPSWRNKELLQCVADAARKYKATSVRALASGLRKPAGMTETTDALVTGGIRLRKRVNKVVT